MSFQRKYNVATVAGTHVRIPIIKAGSLDFSVGADWTPVAGDVEVSKNSAAPVNIGTLPAYVNGMWQFVFTGAELSAKTIDVKIVDSATKAIEDQAFIVETYGNAAALHPFDLGTASASQTADNDTKISLIPTITPLAANLTATVSGQSNIQGRIPTVLLNGRIQANVDAISNDAIAPGNLKLQFNGTGISGTTFPATQDQLSSIANVGSATHKASSSYVLTAGTQTANLFTDTEALNAVRHTHSDVAGVLDLYYQFKVGSGIPASVQVTGFLNSNNDDIDVFGFDWVSSTWKQIGNIQGTNGSTNSVYSLDMFVDMVGSGIDKGTVRVRFFKASGLSGASLAVDQIFIAFTIGLDGYESGSIWFDDAAANAGVEVGIDGTSRNPVSTPAAVESLLVATGLHKNHVAPGSIYTLGTDHSNREVFGNEWSLVLGGQDVSGAHFSGCSRSVTGVAIGTTRFSIHQGSIGDVSLPICDLTDCVHSGKLTLTGVGTYNFVRSVHAMDSGAFQLEFGAVLGNTVVHNHGYQGAITIANMGALGTDEIHLSGNGKVIFEASCVAGGTANVFGMEIVDNSGAGFVINSSGNLHSQNITLQADLDLITAADGVALATLQPNYAPAKAGDQMALMDDALTAAKIATDAFGALELSLDAVNEIADGFLDRDMNAGADTGTQAIRTPRQALRFLRNKWAIVAGTLTVNKEDDLAVSWTSAITTTAGNPVSQSDPADA